MKNAKIVLAIVLLMVVGTIAGCATIQIQPRAPSGVLFVVREDALASRRDTIEVYMNGQKVIESLSVDSYKALHIKPGVYDMEFRIFNSDGEPLKTHAWTGTIESGTSNMCGIAFNFGWKGFRKFITRKKFRPFSNIKFDGELDIVETLQPK